MNLLDAHFLKLTVIWKDDEMFELEITATNSDFFGKTQVYAQPENLAAFTLALKEFPNKSNILFYELGQINNYAYFSIKLYPLGKSGTIGVEIQLESNVATEFRPEEKSKLKLEIITEPYFIDSFQRQLSTMIKNDIGEAILNGVKHF